VNLQTEAAGKSTGRVPCVDWQRGGTEDVGTESSSTQDVVGVHWGWLWIWSRSVTLLLLLRADCKNATQISTQLSATQDLSFHSASFHCKKILCCQV